MPTAEQMMGCSAAGMQFFYREFVLLSTCLLKFKHTILTHPDRQAKLMLKYLKGAGNGNNNQDVSNNKR